MTRRKTWLVPVLSLAMAGLVGCTTTHGQTYRSAEWAAGRPLGRVLVITPPYPAGEGKPQPGKDEQIRAAIREALARVPGTTVVDAAPPAATGADREPGQPVSDAKAIAAARAADAETVCVVTFGAFGGRYLLTALPPGWDSRTTVQYALRVLDANTGEVLVDSVRERTAGGYLAIMTATYPADLTADLAAVLAAPQPH